MNEEREKKRKKQGGFVKFLEDKTALPSDAFQRDTSIEIRERKRLLMRGCRKIIKYSPREMIMAARGFEVRIRGEGLICTAFNTGAVTVEGEIVGVDLGTSLAPLEENV